MSNISYGNSLSTAGQFPLNGKIRFKTIAEMQLVGSNPFRYQEDMVVRCIENHTDYIWRERTLADGSINGVLSEDFVYPIGSIADGISYENRAFNFFVYKTESLINQNNTIRVIEIDPLNVDQGQGEGIIDALVRYVNESVTPLVVSDTENIVFDIKSINLILGEQS